MENLPQWANITLVVATVVVGAIMTIVAATKTPKDDAFMAKILAIPVLGDALKWLMNRGAKKE